MLSKEANHLKIDALIMPTSRRYVSSLLDIIKASESRRCYRRRSCNITEVLYLACMEVFVIGSGERDKLSIFSAKNPYDHLMAEGLYFIRRAETSPDNVKCDCLVTTTYEDLSLFSNF